MLSAIMKVYSERNNLQVELIRCRKKCLLYSRLLLLSDGFTAISPTERKSGGFEHKPCWLRFRQSTRIRVKIRAIIMLGLYGLRL